MKIDVSIGELLDKYSVLELKQKHIVDEMKLRFILREMEVLKPYVEPFFNNCYQEYKDLVDVNKCIWDMNDKVRSGCDMPASLIMEANDKRFRLKNMINNKCNSVIKEQKNFD